MDKSLPRYVLVRCNSCLHHFGSRITVEVSCRLCGATMDAVSVVSRTDDPAELQRLVSDSNIPEKLRDEMNSLSSSHLQEKAIFNESKSEMAMAVLQQSINSEGIVTLESLSISAKSLNLSFDISRLAEYAEIEGLLMRTGVGEWLWLG